MIGHSLGMPKMYVDNLKIDGLGDKQLINAYGLIDSFSGNSGSPIIDEKNKIVVGILIRGEEDFLYDYNYSCNSIKKCKKNECAPVTIMKITPEMSSKLK
jgi:V8-like Glu-specific endopeptidase